MQYFPVPSKGSLGQQSQGPILFVVDSENSSRQGISLIVPRLTKILDDQDYDDDDSEDRDDK